MPLITDKFGKASLVTDVAIATTVKTTRAAGVNVLEAIDLSKYSTDTPVFVVTYRKVTDALTGLVTITQLRSWKALVNTGANTLTNLTIAPGYIDDIGNAVGDFIECIPTTYWENSLIDGIRTALNDDGTLKDLGGWIDVPETWAYSSWDATLKRGVITVPTNATLKYSRGMFVRFTQTTGGAKWGFIHAVTTTTLTVYMGSQTLTNEALTIKGYSYQGTPFGIPSYIKSYNPYKFHAYRVAAQLGNGGATTKMPFDTELYDTNNEFDNVTNFRYSPSVPGFYHFDWKAPVVASNGYNLSHLYKNGVEVKRGDQILTTSGSIGGTGSVDLQVAASDYFEVYYRSDGSGAASWEISTAAPFFNAHMISEG